MLLIAVFYVWPGYTVPPVAYAITFGAAVLAAVVAMMFGRQSSDQAANFADEFFELKDSVASCSHFAEQGHEGGFYDLQAGQTQKLVEQSPLQKINYAFPYKLATIAALTLAVSVALGFKGPSDRVVQQLNLEQATYLQTENANEELKQLIEELDKATDDEEERKLIEPDKLRKWVDELEKTKDPKEAMRQYARLEMKFNKAAKAMQQRRDEKLLDKAAEELKKLESLKKLADRLKSKKYDKASEELKKMKPEDLKNANLSDISKKRKELAKLKAAAKRMAQAARSTAKQSKSSKVSKNKNGNNGDSNELGKNAKSSNANSEGGEMDGQAQKSDSSDLGELLEELEDAVDELDEDLEEMELELVDRDLDENEDFEDFDDMDDAVRGKLDDLGKKLAKMARKRRARSKLKRLGSKCAQCQANGQALVRSPNAGGKKAGTGTSDSTRDERDKLVDNGQNSSIKGIKGSGPSLTKVESADDGTGVSNRRSESKTREFKRQYESFVEREDVPEDLKNGVKNYFTNIHESGEEPATEDEE